MEASVEENEGSREEMEISGHVVEKLHGTLSIDIAAPQNSGPQRTRDGYKVVKQDQVNL
jgi:hypothetical protein